MAIEFASASSQYISTTNVPSLSYPFTIGGWFRPTTVNTSASEYIVGITNTSSDNNYHILGRRGSAGVANWIAYSEDSAAFLGVSAKAGTPTAGRWDFVVTRFVSAANRWCSVLSSTGDFAHTQGTTSHTPTGLNGMYIGVCNFVSGLSGFFNGDVAELWLLDNDIQSDTGQLSNATLYQLAYGGLLSIPEFVSQILFYRGFRQSLLTDSPNDAVVGRRGAMVWTPTGVPTLTSHPPIPENTPGSLGFEPGLITPF